MKKINVALVGVGFGGAITATVNNGGTLATVTDMLIKKEENFSKEKKYDIRSIRLRWKP